MRLLTTRLYRAFPELDTFSDAQCEGFMWAANRSLVRRAARWFVVLFISILGAYFSIVGAVMVINQAVGHPRVIHFLGGGVVLLVGLGLSFALALRSRDWLLSRRVRRVIDERGRCYSCRYSLLGMPVGADLRLTCPECGTSVEADESLNELARDERGDRVFQPMLPREPAAVAARRRKRRRAILKYSSIGIAALLLIVGVSAGLVWRSLERQAVRAQASRNFDARVTELVRGAQPAGALAEPNRYEEMLAILKDADTFSRRFAKDFADRNPTLHVDETRVDWSAPATTDAVGYRKGLKADLGAMQRMAREGLTAWRSEGLAARAAQIPSMRHFHAERAVPKGGSAMEILVPELGYSRSFARLCTARMHMALEAGDKGEFLSAIEQALVVAEAVERQGLLIDHLVGVAIRGLMLNRIREQLSPPTDPRLIEAARAWSGETLSLVRTYMESRTSIAHALRVEREMALDAIRWTFADPVRAARAEYLGDGGPIVYLGAMGSSGGRWPTGGLESNVKELNEAFDVLIAGYEKGAIAGQAVAATVSPSKPLVKILIPAMSKVGGSEIRLEQDARQTMLHLAVESWRERSGAYPKDLEAVADLLPPGSLIDTSSGTRYELRIIEDSRMPGGQRPMIGLAMEKEQASDAGVSEPKRE